MALNTDKDPQMTEHPLSETDATEITDEMIEAGASYAWKEANPGILGWDSLTESHKEGCRRDARAVLTAALAVAPTVDARPWESLDGGRVYVGDEVRQKVHGILHTAVVGRVDEYGDPWTAEGGFIGVLDVGTWHVRHPELPTEDGVTIIPDDKAVGITTTDGRKFTRLMYNEDRNIWVGIDENSRNILGVAPEKIIPNTWKVGYK